jgi:hypothetical protein
MSDQEHKDRIRNALAGGPKGLSEIKTRARRATWRAMMDLHQDGEVTMVRFTPKAEVIWGLAG